MIEFLLKNENWFYVYGIVYFILSIKSIIKSRDKFKLKTSLINTILFWVDIVWMLYGFTTPEMYFFWMLLSLCFIIPIVLNLSYLKKAAKNGYHDGVIDKSKIEKLNQELEDELNKDNSKKFYRFLLFVNTIVVFMLLVNHFKFDLFYLLAL